MQAGTLPFARRRPFGLCLGKALISDCKLLNLNDKFFFAWVAWRTLGAWVEVCISVYGFIGRLASSRRRGMVWVVGGVFGAWAGLVGWPWRGGRAVGAAPGPVVRCADCAAVLSRGAVARKLAALCPGAKLRSNSRAKFDVDVRLAAHPPHGLRASPPAKSPPPRPARHTTLVTGWCAQRESKSRANFDSC